MKVQLPEKMEFLFQPSRYKVAYGGRGSVKSWSFARALLIMAAQTPLRILCAREFQNSIRESVHQLLSQQIDLLHLGGYYRVLATEIRGLTGSEFIFAGIRNNVTKIKSMEGIDICWVEEAEKVSEPSWMVLVPTIRKSGSEIWVSFNPHLESDPTYKRFVINKPPESIVMQTGWRDNPWLPRELVLEKDYLAKVDLDAYRHVWEGGLQTRTDAQVLGGKCIIDAFEPGVDWNGPYFGADWGFASDPVVLLKMWIHGPRLFIEEEYWGIGIELDDISVKFRTVSGSESHTVRSDNSRPETISYLQRHGFPKLIAATKWPGSVEDGIAFLRSFEKIVIHPRCKHTEEEARTYRYKTDKLTGDVLPEIIDANNHCWDSARYGLEPLISAGGMAMFEYFKKQYEERQAARERGEDVPMLPVGTGGNGGGNGGNGEGGWQGNLKKYVEAMR